MTEIKVAVALPNPKKVWFCYNSERDDIIQISSFQMKKYSTWVLIHEDDDTLIFAAYSINSHWWPRIIDEIYPTS